jgi:hypothetical protein
MFDAHDLTFDETKQRPKAGRSLFRPEGDYWTIAHRTSWVC